MDIPKILFATMIRNARMDRHWTQEDLAEKLGLSPAYLGDLERYKNMPSLPVFCNAMRILNLSADDYVYPNGNANNSTYSEPFIRYQPFIFSINASISGSFFSMPNPASSWIQSTYPWQYAFCSSMKA